MALAQARYLFDANEETNAFISYLVNDTTVNELLTINGLVAPADADVRLKFYTNVKGFLLEILTRGTALVLKDNGVPPDFSFLSIDDPSIVLNRATGDVRLKGVTTGTDIPFATEHALVHEGPLALAIWWRVLRFFGAASTPAGAPAVSVRYPTPGALGVLVGDPVVVTFNEPVVALDQDLFYITAADNEAVKVGAPYAYAVSNFGRTVTMAHADLAPFVQYKIFLKAGITDADGNMMGADVGWTFRTAA